METTLDEAELARKFFSYDEETGVVTRTGSLSRATERFKGRAVGTMSRDGYLQTNFCGLRIVRVHRLAWLIKTGKWPDLVIDHINGDKTDNRWCNIRNVSRAVNSQNRTKKSGGSMDLPIGINRMVQNGRVYFQIIMTRNGKKRQTSLASLDKAREVLAMWKEEENAKLGITP
jgi:hypothetical protein